MTEEERTTFIKEKLVPLFDGMNANDVLEIIHDVIALLKAVLSSLTYKVALNQVIVSNSVDLVPAIGIPLEQSQSQFCLHWIPPVLVKQKSEVSSE